MLSVKNFLKLAFFGFLLFVVSFGYKLFKKDSDERLVTPGIKEASADVASCSSSSSSSGSSDGEGGGSAGSAEGEGGSGGC